MLDHIELYVSDLEQSVRFWTPLMQQLGYTPQTWARGVNYLGAAQQAYVCLLQASAEHARHGYHRKRVGLNHVAFRAKSRTHVDEVRAWAKSVGASLLYDQNYPFATSPDYYAVFMEDPDRIKIEVVAPRADFA